MPTKLETRDFLEQQLPILLSQKNKAIESFENCLLDSNLNPKEVIIEQLKDVIEFSNKYAQCYHNLEYLKNEILRNYHHCSLLKANGILYNVDDNLIFNWKL
jgi:hypothetical protein